MYLDTYELDDDFDRDNSSYEHIDNKSSDLYCDVCHKNLSKVDSVVCCSQLGAVSFRYCYDCYYKGLEPYGHLVSYISAAGHFPSDINPEYQKLVRNIILGLNISEKQFIRDVEEEIKRF